jgi:hypothetical protein
MTTDNAIPGIDSERISIMNTAIQMALLMHVDDRYHAGGMRLRAMRTISTMSKMMVSSEMPIATPAAVLVGTN